MVRGLYSSAAGMITQYKKIDVLGNNISNVSTAGFKEGNVTLTTFGEELERRTDDNAQIGATPISVALGRETANLENGTLENTGLSTDLGIAGEGFFAVRAADGEVKYTRGGDFVIDADGCLALPSGEQLLSSDGTPLYVGNGNFVVGADGTVTLENGATEKINLYTATNIDNIQKRKDGFFDIAGAIVADGEIKQGWLEQSNTDIVGNITGLMESVRAFQGCQQAFQTSLQTLDKLVNEIGTVK